MFGLTKRAFTPLLSFGGSLANIVNVSDCTKCISLNKQPCMVRPGLIDLYPDSYNKRLSYYPFWSI